MYTLTRLNEDFIKQDRAETREKGHASGRICNIDLAVLSLHLTLTYTSHLIFIQIIRFLIFLFAKQDELVVFKQTTQAKPISNLIFLV